MMPKALRRFLLIGSGVLALLLVIAVTLGPRLLMLPSVQPRLSQELSTLVQGSVAWDGLEARILPTPQLRLNGVRINAKDRVVGTADSLDVRLALWPLLRGHIQIAAVSLMRPALRIELPPSTDSTSPTNDPLLLYQRFMSTLTGALKKFAPDLGLDIQQATFDIHAAGITPIKLSNAVISAQSSADGIKLEARAASTLWQTASLQGHVGYAALDAELNLDVSQLQAQALLAPLQADAPVTISIPHSDIGLHVNTDGHTALRLKLDAKAPAASAKHGARELALGALSVQATALSQGGTDAIDVTSLKLGGLLPEAALKLKVGADGRNPQLSLNAPAVDLQRLRNAAQQLAPEQAWVRDFIATVEGGQVSALQLAAQGESFGTLFSASTISGSLQLQNGALRLPARITTAAPPELISDIGGQLEIAAGKLVARAARARLGKIHALDGEMTYALESGQLQLGFGYDVDAAQGISLVRHVVPSRVRTSLEQIEAMSGSLQGKARIERKVEKQGARWSVLTDITKSSTNLRLRDLPLALRPSKGRVAFEAGQVRISGLVGAIGNTTVSAASADLTLGEVLAVKSGSAQLNVALAETFAWLKQQASLSAALSKVSSLDGRANVTVNQLSGRIDQPGDFSFDISAQPINALITSPELPAPLALNSGTAHLNPQRMTLAQLQLALLDSHASVSGNIDAYRSSKPTLSLSIADGLAGAQLTAWAMQKTDAPARLAPKTPIQFTASQLGWSAATGVNAVAALAFPGGQKINTDLAWQTTQLDVRNLSLKDDLSNATLKLRVQRSAIDANYNGSLDARSISSLFATSGERPGKVSGSMQAAINREHRSLSTATGHLQAESIDLHKLVGLPLRVDHISLQADGTTLQMPAAEIHWGEQRASAQGQIRFGAQGPVIDAHIKAGDIDMDALFPSTSSASSAQQEHSTDKLLKTIWPLPLSGKITLQADALHDSKRRIDTLVAQLELAPQRAHLDVTQARLCGLSLPLSVDASAEGINATLQVRATAAPIAHSIECLSEKQTELTGTFDLAITLATHGYTTELVKNLGGHLQFEARDGVVNRMAFLGKILELTDVASLLDKDQVRLGARGLPYRRMLADGELHGTRFDISQAAFDSHALGVAATGSINLQTYDADLNLLVAPFSRADKLISHVPIVGYVLGDTLASVPLKVSGDIRDPRIVPLDLRALSGELFGIFERTLKLPAHLFTPTGKPAPAQKQTAPQ